MSTDNTGVTAAATSKIKAYRGDRFFNCHAHCFTMDHVPDYFFGKGMPVTRLLNQRRIKGLVMKGPVTGGMPFWLRVLIFFLSLINLMSLKELKRLLTMVRFGNTDKQVNVIEAMRQYYPHDTGYVLLTMDMEYMGAGAPRQKFRLQLEELAALKKSAPYKDLIYPFVFTDPRRIAPRGKEKEIEREYTGDAFMNDVRRYIEEGTYQGIKLYPALGYYPFDERLKEVYNLAIQYDLPLITHCTMGIVRHRNKLPAAERVHPIKGKLPNLKTSEYQQYFSHPLNYECLLNKNILDIIWKEDAPDYSQLKMCIGHWGSGADWRRYLENDWADLYDRTRGQACPALDLNNWHVEPKESYLNFTWFSIIYELLKSDEYPNIYTDISYTLNDARFLPMLKMMLESNQKVREHVLFGTDFYMVSKAISEREYSINIRAYLGEELFQQIAVVNPYNFLSNKLCQVKEQLK